MARQLEDILAELELLTEKQRRQFPPTDIRSYSLASPMVVVPIEELDFEELKHICDWPDAPSRDCCLAYLKNRGITESRYLNEALC